MKEEWVKVLGFDNYSASSLGRVRSDCGRRKGTILKPYLDKDGYETYRLFQNKKFNSVKGHRIILMSFQPFNPTLGVNHINGLKRDNRVVNLEAVTPKENNIHARENGLIVPQKGEDASRAKMTNLQVLEIKNLILSGSSTSYILNYFGLNKKSTIITRIKSGSDWSSITGWNKDTNPIKDPTLIRC